MKKKPGWDQPTASRVGAERSGEYSQRYSATKGSHTKMSLAASRLARYEGVSVDGLILNGQTRKQLPIKKRWCENPGLRKEGRDGRGGG